MKKPLISEILKKLEKEAGVKIILEPEFGFSGQIVLKDNRKRYFRGTSIDINTLGASDIAKDKDYAAYFMKKMGYPVTESYKFYSDKWAKTIKSDKDIDKGYQKAQNLSFPVILKPNDGSQGRFVTKVYNKNEYYKIAKEIFKKHNVMLLQKVAQGKDYRIVILDGKVISAYERIPLSITGNGKNTVKKLLDLKQKSFIKTGRDTQIDMDDQRIKMKLKREGLSFDSVIDKDKKIFLLDNANLSSGGDAIDVTEWIGDGFKNIAIKLSRDMNLRFSGVDIMTEDSIDSNNPKKYVVLEINAAPGLDHYAFLGSKQKKIVHDLYKKVLQSLKK
jgi:D-alanine-D-alanine ligase-like ATP-grasp enzyme